MARKLPKKSGSKTSPKLRSPKGLTVKGGPADSSSAAVRVPTRYASTIQLLKDMKHIRIAAGRRYREARVVLQGYAEAVIAANRNVTCVIFALVRGTRQQVHAIPQSKDWTLKQLRALYPDLVIVLAKVRVRGEYARPSTSYVQLISNGDVDVSAKGKPLIRQIDRY